MLTSGFSVVVPTFRRAAQLTSCLEGLSRLDFPRDRYEVIVVDDGGPESLELIVAPWRTRIDVTLVVQSNAGPAAARNTGAARAKFSWLAFIDDDCVPQRGWLSAFGKAFHENPHELFGGNTINALVENVFSSASQQLVSYVCGYYDGRKGRTRLFTSNNMAVGTDDFRAIGGFDTRFSRAAGEDREFCDRWVAEGRGSRFIGEAEVRHLHAMTLRTFCRQQYQYGCGAALFRRARAAREGGTVRVEPLSFYVNLIRHPFKARASRAVRMSLLLTLAQVAGATGFLWASLREPKVRHTD